MDRSKYPPLIQQFIDNQLRYPDAIVATEVGGFFEIWQVEDVGHAIRASQLLDTVLTRRNKSDPDSPYMTGFPNHSAEGYFKTLVDLGETVVIVEQHIRGRKADGNKNVTRQISKILSPGTVIEHLTDSQNNFFASLYYEKEGEHVGVSLLDLSTGEVKISEMSVLQTQDFLDKVKPREILISGSGPPLRFHEKQVVHKNSDQNLITKLSVCGQLLANLYEIPNPTSNHSYAITALGLEFWRLGVLALGNILNYLSSTEYNVKLLKKLARPEVYAIQNHLVVPLNGFLSLEVFQAHMSQDESRTLYGVLNRCKTAMGRRKLKQWLLTPLGEVAEIKARHEKVEQYLKQQKFFAELQNVYDIARLSRRLIFARLLPHELAHFYQSLAISEDILKYEAPQLYKHAKAIKKQINQNIDVPAAEVYTDKHVFNFFIGQSQEKLKAHYNRWKESEADLQAYLENLCERLGTEKLRMSEKSESFFLSGPKGLVEKAKKANIQVQVKANDVLIVDETWEQKSLACFGLKQAYIFQAEEVWREFQQELATQWGPKFLEISEKIAEVDVLANFAQLAKERGYQRPQLMNQEHAAVNLKNLRHPVVENSRDLQEPFVANDVHLDADQKTLVIYGANSAGKSTILKSVALSIIMAQVGSFIPADAESSLTVFNSLLTRMSSFDSLSEGLSTFTMEMTELQLALQHATKKSLFLFDEIGRGTSVEDGEAIAFATLAYLDKPENRSVTLFATHYHSLYEQIKDFKSLQIANVHCYANEQGQLVFARKLKAGPGSGSYGIEVAKSCGLPEELIRTAQRYNKQLVQVKVSRYNTQVTGTLCPICQENPVQQTHHIHEQKQGQVKQFTVDGAVREINTQSNLLMICAACHEKITRGELEVNKRKVLGTSDAISIEVKRRG